MPILKKFGYPPVANILAECDLALTELVCTEFGYRSDEKWGYTQDGSAVLSLKDVHVIISRNCQLLLVVVGGSPCEDLTFASPLQGVLGLIGPSIDTTVGSNFIEGVHVGHTSPLKPTPQVFRPGVKQYP